MSLSVWIQRRLKKEKKAKRKLQEALDFESRRREQVERALKHPDPLTGETPPLLQPALSRRSDASSAVCRSRANVCAVVQMQ